MRAIDAISAVRRPPRSPSRPYSTPPSGRARKPDAKTANVLISEVSGSLEGKKSWAVTGAR